MTAQTPPQTIRPLADEDLEAVIALDRETAGRSRRGFFEKRLSAALKRPRDYVYVGLHQGGHLTGFAMARLINGAFGKPGAGAALDAVGVSSAAQGKGAGQKMLTAVREILVHKGVSEFETQVDWSDRALLGFLGHHGFTLAPRIILSRATDPFVEPSEEPETSEFVDENDYSSPKGDDFTALSRDRVPVRSMARSDLDAIIRIDRKLSGIDRGSYFALKQEEVLHQSGVRLSLVAELDGLPVGFIMARVDFGEFGHAEAEAVMDTFGVDPGFQGHGVGKALMSQLIANLSSLRVDSVRTEVAWDDVSLIAFFSLSGFRPTQRISLTCAL